MNKEADPSTQGDPPRWLAWSYFYYDGPSWAELQSRPKPAKTGGLTSVIFWPEMTGRAGPGWAGPGGRNGWVAEKARRAGSGWAGTS